MPRLRSAYVPRSGPLICPQWKLEDLGTFLDNNPGAEWSRHRAKVSAFCATWTREERDTWILTGEEPVTV
jgi:hypothetical protein